MKVLLTTLAISNCLFSPTSENPRGFSVWCVPPKADKCDPTQLLIAETVDHTKLEL
jgi:hypothetical protein